MTICSVVFFCYSGASFGRLDASAETALTHTVTHMPKCPERHKQHRKGS